MASIYEIPTKKLFVAASILKISSSLVTLAVSDTGFLFWLLALIIPVTVMAIYVFVGVKRIDRTLSDEKFADSCYYLGFLFTIMAIAISLIDIGGTSVSIEAMAWRFGVAMVSTVIGMAVRVYLVNFKIEVTDGIAIVEDALINGSLRFTHSLEIASDSYKRFETEINTSTNQVIEHINQRLEKLTKDHTERLDDHFNRLTESTQKLMTDSMTHINNAGVSVVEAANTAKAGIKSVMVAFEVELVSYQSSLRQKLDAAVLPDNFFTSKLNPALQLLVGAVQKHEGVLISSSEGVAKVAEEMTIALGAMNRRSVSAARALDTLEKTAVDGRELTVSVKDLLEQVKELTQNFNDTAANAPTQQVLVDQFASMNQLLLDSRNAISAQVQEMMQAVTNAANSFPNQEALTERSADIVLHIKDFRLQVSDALERLRNQTTEGSQAEGNATRSAIQHIEASFDSALVSLSNLNERIIKDFTSQMSETFASNIPVMKALNQSLERLSTLVESQSNSTKPSTSRE